MGTRVCFLFTLVSGAYLCDAYKILAVFPLQGRSLSILGEGYVRNLLKAGHEVTYLTPFPMKESHKNLTQIDCTNEEASAGVIDMLNIEKVLNKEHNIRDSLAVFKIMGDAVHGSFTTPNVQALLNDHSAQFDLVIVPWLGLETIAAFSVVFDVPYIWFSTVDPHWLVLDVIDERSNPAYTPDIQSSNIPPFTFTQRVKELATQVLTSIIKKVLLYKETTFYEEVIGPIVAKRGRTLPPLETVIYNASLVLSNSHYSLGQPIRLPQNMISIGGYHINRDVKPLPKDLQTLMNKSKNGVIYFSMGSNLKSKQLPSVLKQSLLKMFASLPYTVLWKFEETWENLPKNVHVLQWAPQPSILAHPNCVLFITHGGLLSTTETVHFGVPIIGIPVFGDQFVNVQRSVGRGYALQVDLSYTMADDLKNAISEMTSNSSYREKVKTLSALYHDRPIQPADEMVFWVEHVIKTKGAPHLRSPALDVPFYQKCYLDLAALILAAVLIVRTLIKYLLFSIKKRNVDNKKKKN